MKTSAALIIATIATTPAAAGDWSGLYVGVGGQYTEFGGSNRYSGTSSEADIRGMQPSPIVRLGYDYERRGVLVGVGLTIARGASDDADIFVPTPGAPGDGVTIYSDIDVPVTLTARAGIVSERWLVYAEGGIAFVETETDMIFRDGGVEYEANETDRNLLAPTIGIGFARQLGGGFEIDAAVRWMALDWDAHPGIEGQRTTFRDGLSAAVTVAYRF